MSLRKVAAEVKEKTSKDISYVTVKRVLNENHLFAYSPIKKPLLSKKNIPLRKKLSEKFFSAQKKRLSSNLL
jgi:hypothetical protein